MKKFLIPVLLLSMIAVFAGCSHKQASVQENPETPAVEEVQETIVEEPVQDIASSEAVQN